MPEKLQNRSTAALLTALVVILSILFGGGTSLSRLRSQAEDYYEHGSRETGWRSISSDLSTISYESWNLIELLTKNGGKYLKESDKLLVQLENSSMELYDQPTPAKTRAAAQEMRALLDELDQKVAGLTLDDMDETLYVKTMANIDSAYKAIEQSGYNDAARAFNRTLRTFPANVLSVITGVKPLELYE